MNFKRALFLSTSLSAASVLAMNAAIAAEKPKLKISGYQETYFGLADVDSGTTSTGTPTYDGGIVDGAFTILQYGEIRFTATGTTDSGMGWGVYFEKAVNDADTDGKKKSTDEANTWLQGSWGKFEIGGQDGAADKMQIDAQELSLMDVRIASAFADTRGNSLRGAEDQVSVLDSSDATKITYYTPRVSGVQFGLSWVPSAGSEGTVPSGSTSGQVESGLTYTGKAGDAKYEVAAVYANNGESATNQSIEGYGVGGKVEFNNITLSAAYTRNDNFRADRSEQEGWTASASYNAGKWSAALIYVENELSLDAGGADDEYRSVQLQGGYSFGGGLTGALALTQFDNDARTTSRGNDGTTLVGMLTAKF